MLSTLESAVNEWFFVTAVGTKYGDNIRRVPFLAEDYYADVLVNANRQYVINLHVLSQFAGGVLLLGRVLWITTPTSARVNWNSLTNCLLLIKHRKCMKHQLPCVKGIVGKSHNYRTVYSRSWVKEVYGKLWFLYLWRFVKNTTLCCLSMLMPKCGCCLVWKGCLCMYKHDVCLYSTSAMFCCITDCICTREKAMYSVCIKWQVNV